MTIPTTDVPARPGHLRAELSRLEHDDDMLARAVGAALGAAVLDTLDDEERRWVARIEALRAEMDSSTEQIDVALPNRRGEVKLAELGDTCRRRSKKRLWGVFLLALARRVAPDRGIELGTCLGISSAYLAAGMQLSGRGRLWTLEGAPALAARSAENLASLGLDDVEVVAGLFAETLAPVLREGGPVRLAFIDGHHQEDPTLAYFDQIAAHLTDPAVVVFDDINWSEGMVRAWSAILVDPRIRVAVDVTGVGVCVVAPASDVPARVYRFPTITSLQPALAHADGPGTP